MLIDNFKFLFVDDNMEVCLNRLKIKELFLKNMAINLVGLMNYQRKPRSGNWLSCVHVLKELLEIGGVKNFALIMDV